jgi:hypothetical protein
MDYFAGLDVSVKETSVCIVDDAGKIVRAPADWGFSHCVFCRGSSLGFT